MDYTVSRRHVVGCYRAPSTHGASSNYRIHYNDVIMGALASLINSLTFVYSTVYSDADQRKHQSSASLALVWGIHRASVNSPYKWPVQRKMFPFDDVIMITKRSPRSRDHIIWSRFLGLLCCDFDTVLSRGMSYIYPWLNQFHQCH